MRAAMNDPAMLEFAPGGVISRLEWVSGYSDYVYIPRQFIIDGRLLRCLVLLGAHAVFLEIAIPTCSHICVRRVPELELIHQPHGRTVLWGDERKVINVQFIKSKFNASLIIHPVKLSRLTTEELLELEKIIVW